MANRKKIEKLEDLIKENIDGKLLEQTVTSLLPPGENYGSVMFKVDFKVEKDGKEEEHHAVAKCTPPNTVTQELFNIQRTFKTEIAWYTTIIPTLKQFQRDQGIEKEIDYFQTFYGARISLDPTTDKVDLDGVILTQNLKYLGYYNIDRHIGFDLPTTHAILRDLANFHAVSLAIRIQKPDIFYSKLRPYFQPFDHISPEMVQEIQRKIFTVLDQVPECQSIADKIKAIIKQGIIFGNRPVREPWVTILHLDFWTNNIMVTGGKYSKTMILDLQTANSGSPAADLVFFLLTSVNYDLIQGNFDDLVKFYYEQFSKNLKELNVSINNFSFEGLLHEIGIEIRSGELGHALHHTIFILGEKGKSDFDSSDENFKQENFEYRIDANAEQKEKFRWIIFEAIKRKWIEV